MARTTNYKQYTRNQRRAVLDTDYSHGMMSSDGIITEGYLKTLVNMAFEKEHTALIPRPSLRPYHFMFPYDLTDSFGIRDYSHAVTIKDCKECVESGKTYYQTLVGSLNEGSGDTGEIVVFTSEKPENFKTVDTGDDYSYLLRLSEYAYDTGENSVSVLSNVAYSTAELPEIHGLRLSIDPVRRVEFPVGTFAFGNSYYCFTRPELVGTVGSLNKTVFDSTLDPPQYKFETVTPKELSVSEAVSYGYNMLLGSGAYVFNNLHAASTMQFLGILPYEVEVLNGAHQYTNLLMTPKKNQPIDLVCYFDVENNRQYDIIWEWRKTDASDWTEIQRETITFTADTNLTLDNFRPPASDIMVRVSAYYYDNGVLSDFVEKAIVVGFDFTVENYGTAAAVEQKVYDLSTATGMESWNGRLVVWGLPEDPTVLFLSDYNEPAYFPYPNNVVVFDEPIIYAVQFMDTLAVFTTDKLYQVTLASDGNSWQTTVIQSHLKIEPWDKHLIQTVRNMLYFKSGNYYYMMVPKAQSLTGELTLAPITTPITSFFNNFAVNVQNILKETYDYTDDYELISYYNFLDYEDIHNVYLFIFGEDSALLHFDVIYNTVDRTWKVWIYESANILYPYRVSATEPGILATSSVIGAVMGPDTVHPVRIIQLFCWDTHSVRDIYLPDDLMLNYDANATDIDVIYTSLYTDNDDVFWFEDTTWFLNSDYAFWEDDSTTLYLIGVADYYSGFSTIAIKNVLNDVYTHPEEYFTFRNYQFLDTGYRDDELQSKKRYREVQLQVNNLDQRNLCFGMDYILDGAPRKIFYKYDSVQTIDEFDPEYGVSYVESTPYLETELSSIDLTNQWTIDQSLFPEISLWKVRVAISGKGSAPRLKLKSRNNKRYELISINWVSKLMNMR